MARLLGVAVSRYVELGYGECRMWRNEPIPGSFQADRTIEYRSGALHARAQPSSALLGIELVLPGPKINYGLLGLRFEPTSLLEGIVRVGVVKSVGTPLSGLLAPRFEKTYAGLPEEYADYVAIALQQELMGAGVSGIATVDHAAHGLIGSSPRLFRRLCVLLVGFLLNRLDESEPAVLSHAIREANQYQAQS
jgi:hypothetical protein